MTPGNPVLSYGKPLSEQAQGIHCLLCVDKAISSEIEREDIRPAFTTMPIQQMIPVGIGQAMPFMVPVPTCYECRRDMLGNASTNGGLLRG